MKTNYIINKNILIVNIYYLNTSLNLKNIINLFLIKNNIKFKGKKIIVYQNDILIGTFYLTNYYLKKFNFNTNNYLLTNKNSYYQENNYLELNKNNKLIKEKITNVL